MAINISNVGDSWTVKLFRETWYFTSVDEFLPVLKFCFDNSVLFTFSRCNSGFSVSMKDINLRSCSFFMLHEVLDLCLDFKCRFGDSSRVGVSRLNGSCVADFHPDVEF